MADASDLKSDDPKGRMGSTPFSGISSADGPIGLSARGRPSVRAKSNFHEFGFSDRTQRAMAGMAHIFNMEVLMDCMGDNIA